MKKTLLLLFTVVFMGCSSNDDSNSDSNSNSSFNPPSWANGRWVEQTLKTIGYKFTSNDFILIAGATEISIGGQIKTLINAGGEATINEEIKTSTEYKFSYTIQSITQHYHFVKVSNTEIKDQINDPNGYNLYVKQ